jgi:hypothetical protein
MFYNFKLWNVSNLLALQTNELGFVSVFMLLRTWL